MERRDAGKLRMRVFCACLLFLRRPARFLLAKISGGPRGCPISSSTAPMTNTNILKQACANTVTECCAISARFFLRRNPLAGLRDLGPRAVRAFCGCVLWWVSGSPINQGHLFHQEKINIARHGLVGATARWYVRTSKSGTAGPQPATVCGAECLTGLSHKGTG